MLFADAEGGAMVPFTPGRAKPLALLSVLCLAVLVATLSVHAHYPARALFFLFFPVKDFLPAYVRAWLER